MKKKRPDKPWKNNTGCNWLFIYTFDIWLTPSISHDLIYSFKYSFLFIYLLFDYNNQGKQNNRNDD